MCLYLTPPTPDVPFQSTKSHVLAGANKCNFKSSAGGDKIIKVPRVEAYSERKAPIIESKIKYISSLMSFIPSEHKNFGVTVSLYNVTNSFQKRFPWIVQCLCRTCRLGIANLER